MFVSDVGKVKLMTTNALALPLTCHSPAFAAAGATVVATPLMTVPKLRSRMVAIVIPVVTTTASAATKLEPPCACRRGAERVADDLSAQIRQRDAGTQGTLAVVHADDGPHLEGQTDLNRRGVAHACDRNAAGLGGDDEPQPVLAVRQSDGRPGEEAHGLALPWRHRQATGERLDPRQRGGRRIRRQGVEPDPACRT